MQSASGNGNLRLRRTSHYGQAEAAGQTTAPYRNRTVYIGRKNHDSQRNAGKGEKNIMEISENDLKVLSMFFHDDVDHLGRITVSNDPSNRSYPDFLISCEKATGLTANEIETSAKSLHRNKQVDIGFKERNDEIELISIRIRREGCETYFNYRDKLTDKD